MENLDEKLLEEELLKQHEKDQLEEMMLEEELLNQFENQLESTLNKFEVQVEEQLENLLPTIENQLFGEGNALTMALPSELGDALIGSTISGDSVLASAMRFKFFGALDLLSALPAGVNVEEESNQKCSSNNGETVASRRRTPTSAASHETGAGLGARLNSTEGTGVSQLMIEASDLMNSLPASMAKQVITSILDDESAIAAKLRERVVLLLLAAREVPSTPPPQQRPPTSSSQHDSAVAHASSAPPTEIQTSPNVAEGPEEEDEPILLCNISRATSRNNGLEEEQRFPELLSESATFLQNIPEAPARSLLGAALEGHSYLAAAFREHLYEEAAKEEAAQMAAKEEALRIKNTASSSSYHASSGSHTPLLENPGSRARRSSARRESKSGLPQTPGSKPGSGGSARNRDRDASLLASDAPLPRNPGSRGSTRSLASPQRVPQLASDSPLHKRPGSRGSTQGSESPEKFVRRRQMSAASMTPDEALIFLQIGDDVPPSLGGQGPDDSFGRGYGDISPIGSAFSTPRTPRGGPLTPLSELSFRSLELVRRLPNASAVALASALLASDSSVASGIRDRLRKMKKRQPPLEKRKIFSVKHNNCTTNGLRPTLGVISEGSADVEGVLLDKFGALPPHSTEQTRVRLDEEQAYQLTLRIEFAGKDFVVEPYTWQRLDKCEETALFRTRIFRDGREDFVLNTCLVGEVRSDGVTGGWSYHEFDVDASWNAFELLAEANNGQILLVQGERPTDKSYNFGLEKAIAAAKKEWEAKEIEVDFAQKNKKQGDSGQSPDQLLELTKQSSVLYKKMKALMDARPKAFCHVFPRTEELVHMQVVSKKVGVGVRDEAPVEMPSCLEGALFPGSWHVAFKCTSDPRHPMSYRLGIRYTKGTHLQKAPLRATTSSNEDSEAEKERKRKAEEAKAIKNADLRALDRIKWENWNKVDLAKALMTKFKDQFYPPKNHEKSVKMQAAVRGFLARQRLKWLQQVGLRRIQLKEKEEKMKEELAYEDKLLIRKNREKRVPQELDDLRFAEGAAMMLKYGDLQNPYLLAQAARAIFNVMDEDGSGSMDVGEVRKALKMLGIEQVKDEDLELLVKHFDVDRSGTIDREEFRKMVQTLCCGGKDIMTALKQVTNLHTSKLVVKKKPPVVHEVTAVNPDEMTASQLANQLTMLKMRLSNRNASDKAKKEKEDAEKAAAEELRIAGEKDRQERIRKHTEEMQQRKEQEAAAQANANEVLDAAIFKTAIALCELLGDAVSLESGGEDLEQRIAKLFKKVNINNDGEITFDEFQRAIVDTDIFVQEEMLTMTFHTFDLDLNQCLNLEEFSDMCTNLLEVRAKKQKEASAKQKKK